MFNAGETVDLGAGNLLSNDGTLSPGGSGSVTTTTLTADLEAGVEILRSDRASFSVGYQGTLSNYTSQHSLYATASIRF